MKTEDRHKAMCLVIFLFFISLYSLTRTKVFGCDSLCYLMSIQKGTFESLLHPHHLFFNPLCFAVSKGIEISGIPIVLITALQLLNIAFGALATSLLFLTLIRLTSDNVVSTVSSLAFGLSFVLWHYTSEIEVYVIPISFLLLVLFAMAVDRPKSGGPGTGPVLLGLLIGLAALLHQMHLLFVVVVAFGTIVSHSIETRLRRWVAIAVAVFLISGIYATAALLSGVSLWPDEFLKWFTKYHGYGVWGGEIDIYNIKNAALGFYDSLVPVWSLRMYILQIKDLGALDFTILSLYFVHAISLMALLGIIVVSVKRVLLEYREIALVCVLWIIFYGGFILWWEPRQHKYWINVLPPLCVLVGLSLPDPGRRERVRRVCLIGLLAAGLIFPSVWINLSQHILPASRKQANYHYHFAERLAESVSPGDLVVVPKFYLVGKYTEYYFDRKLRFMNLTDRRVETSEQRQEAMDNLTDEIEMTLQRGDKVLISEHEIHPFDEMIVAPFERQRFSRDDLRRFYGRYKDRLIPEFSYFHGFGRWRGAYTMFRLYGEPEDISIEAVRSGADAG